MPIYGRYSPATPPANPNLTPIPSQYGPTSAQIVSNLPTLPFPMTNGKITWTDSFNSNTTATIEYEGIPEDVIPLIEAAYSTYTRITLYGIPFEVVEYGYEVRQELLEDEPLNTYSVSIPLEGIYFKIDEDTQKLATKIGYISYPTGSAVALGNSSNPYTVGSNGLSFNKEVGFSKDAGWSFSRNEVTVNGKHAVKIPSDGYNEADLSFGNGSDASNSAATSNRTIFVAKEPVTEELVQASKDFDQPPENTTVLRDLSLNAHFTGDKKVWRWTKTVNGKPESEIIKTNGFAYLAKDIAAGDELRSTHPEDFWMGVEHRETQYIYQSIGGITLNVFVQDPQTGQPVNVIVHPDYTDFVNVGGGGEGTVTLRSNAEFLTEIVTRGWKLLPMANETASDDSRSPDSDYYELFQFRKIPLIERTVYQLKPARGLFGEKVDPPFSIEFADYDSLEPRFKNLVGARATNTNSKVAILTPDPNFVEPLYIAKEITYTNCFAWANDPKGQEPDPDDFIPGTNNPLPPPRLTTGQESYNEIDRTLKQPERYADGTVKSWIYTELVKEYSSQDPGFDNAIEHISFNEVSGNPPEPTYRLRTTYEKKEVGNGRVVSGNGSSAKYTVTTPDNAFRFEKGEGSASASDATNVSEALNQLQLQLRLSSMQQNQSSITVFGFYPDMRAGQPVAIDGDRFASLGTWRAMSITWSLEYKGTNNELTEGFPLVTHSGTQITRGLDQIRPISLGQGRDETPDSSSGGDPNVFVSVKYAPADIGAVLPNLETRRNF